MKKELQLLALISILTIFSLIVWPGYDVFMGDHKLYMPPILQTLTPELFQNDLLLNFPPMKYSFFDELIVFLVKFSKTDIFHIFFMLTIIVRFLLIYSIYKILYYFTNDSLFPFFPIFLFIVGRFMNVTSFNTYLVPRGISLAFNLLFVAFYLNDKKLLSTLFLGIGLLINPIICLPFLLLFYLDMFILSNKINSININSLLLGFVPVLFLITLLINVAGTGAPVLGLFNTLDPLWDEILRFRFHDLYLLSWKNFHIFLFAVISICCFLISRLELSHIFQDTAKKKYLYFFFLIPLFSILIYIIGLDIFKFNIIATTQIIRSRFLWQIIIVPLFIYYAYKHIKTSPDDYLYNFSLIGICISFSIRGGTYAELLYIPTFTFLWIKRKYDLLDLTKNSFINRKRVPFIIFTLSIIGISSIPILTSDLKALLYLVLSIPLSLFATLIIAWQKDLLFGHKPVYIVLIIMVLSSISYLPKYNIYPDYYEDKSLMEACNWIKNNTDKRDVFISEPFSKASGPLRLSCYRNIFTTFEDGGGGAHFNRDYAVGWKKRYDLVVALKDNNNLLSKTLNKYDVDYVFSDYKLNVTYPLVFNNTKYFIYILNEPTG